MRQGMIKKYKSAAGLWKAGGQFFCDLYRLAQPVLALSEWEDLHHRISGYLTRHIIDVLMETHVIYCG